jgi:predicted nucleotidyltransferase
MFVLDVIKALEQRRVAYALVGGYAVALHGAVRGTVDIDLVIGLQRPQMLAAEAALQGLGLVSRLPVTAEEVFAFREEYIRNRNLVAWSFYNPNNPLEAVDILITEDVAGLRTEAKPVQGVQVQVLAIPDLIALKQKAARPQDLEDIRALEKLQGKG